VKVFKPLYTIPDIVNVPAVFIVKLLFIRALATALQVPVPAYTIDAVPATVELIVKFSVIVNVLLFINGKFCVVRLLKV
jgi:hypothetical protein